MKTSEIKKLNDKAIKNLATIKGGGDQEKKRIDIGVNFPSTPK